MENYKKTMRLRMQYLSLVMVIAVITIVLLLSNRSRLPVMSDFILGFQSGIFIGMVVGLVSFIIKFKASLRNDEELKKQYIKENDEREKLIGYKASVFVIIALLISLAFGTVVSGFFNEIVFFTLLSVLAILIIMAIAALTFYKRVF